MTRRTPLSIDDSVQKLRGVGAERAKDLARLGIHTIRDLLLHTPRRYEDRRNVRKISQLTKLEQTLVIGTVVDLGIKRFRKGRLSRFDLIVDDSSGRLHCRWWQMPFLQEHYQKGLQVVVCGKVRDLRPPTMDHPEVEIVEGPALDQDAHVGRIVPVYPLTEGITQHFLRRLIWHFFTQEELNWPETIPTEMLQGRPKCGEAIRMLHLPHEMDDPPRARERLAIEEFVQLQRMLLTRRLNLEAKAPRLICPGDNRLIKRFLPKLGYELTEAQKRVLRQIRDDFSNGVPMRRLLQGDVGAGKTVVAGCAALMAIESGYNVALMAPTEILAEQHFQNFARWFTPLGVSVHLRTGSVRTNDDPVQLKLDRSAAEYGIVVGTHALIQGSFNISRLGAVIIDEQHRFGVAQREELVRKGVYPHLLVMTATPIPRTLGLTLYGDLDVSLLDQLPPGRKPIRTYVRTPEKLPKVWEFVRGKIRAGQQAYVVYARVEDDSQEGTKAVLKEEATLQKALAPARVAALHGKLKADDKEQIMSAFRHNKIQVLVASSLIEVGVDVPNATVMVIENAEQFGLAQLHQLRGRIGRGACESYCILISTAKTEEARERLAVLERTTDGFEIAEADLKFRGPGEFLGQQQSGAPAFRFGDLLKDLPLLKQARSVAFALVNPATAPKTPLT